MCAASTADTIPVGARADHDEAGIRTIIVYHHVDDEDVSNYVDRAQDRWARLVYRETQTERQCGENH